MATYSLKKDRSNPEQLNLYRGNSKYAEFPLPYPLTYEEMLEAELEGNEENLNEEVGVTITLGDQQLEVVVPKAYKNVLDEATEDETTEPVEESSDETTKPNQNEISDETQEIDLDDSPCEDLISVKESAVLEEINRRRHKPRLARTLVEQRRMDTTFDVMRIIEQRRKIK